MFAFAIICGSTKAALIVTYSDGTFLETRMSKDASKFETCITGSYINFLNTDNFIRYTNVTIRIASQTNFSNTRIWNVLQNVKINANATYSFQLEKYYFFDVPTITSSVRVFRFDALGNFTRVSYDLYGAMIRSDSCIV